MAPARAQPAPPDDLIAVARTAELQDDGPHALSAGALDLVAVRTAAGLRVYGGRCPHQGALLGEGELEGGALVCRNHRWRFDAVTGARLGGPQCLVACPAVERDGELLVDPTPLAAGVTATRTGLRRIEDLPRPGGLPVVGNMLQLDLPRLHQVFEGWARTHGPLFQVRLGPRRRIVAVADRALAEPILRARPETFRRVGNLEPVFQEMGVAGVFSAEGADWRPQRRLAMEALSHRHLRTFHPTLVTVTERLRRRWHGAAERGEALDIVEELKRFTVDVTTMLTFGQDLNTIEHPGEDVIQRHLELVFPAFNRRLFAVIPLWRVVRLPRDRRLDRALGALREWLGTLVASARARLQEDPTRPPGNFLEAMLAARDDAGQGFSDQVIFGNLMTMLLAGEDTTAFTLGWVVHQLCDSPEVMARARAELRAVLGGAPVPTDLETANRLPYLGAVANETMRLRPVAPLIFFEAITDTTLGDLAVPAGTPVLVLSRPAALDPRHFQEPERFSPERWLEPPATHEPGAHIPFGSGPRICPGRTLALLEMKVLLAMLIQEFDLERVGTAQEVRESFSFTMSPVGLRVRLRRRAPAG
jgi:cytochrome P450/nitrite reductase/ring-hydroxylating ferredoxin subunit